MGPVRKAMISSTAIDLPEHRKEAIAACLKTGFQPLATEHMPAQDATAIKASLDMVDEADVYIGIYGHRYGWIPKGHDISITEMEFDRAVERGMPILVFTMHDDHPIVRKQVEDGAAAQKKLAKFKKRAKERVCAHFRSAIELGGQVIHALSELPTAPAEVEAAEKRIQPSAAEPIIAPTRLRHGAEHLFGREKELAALDRAWEDPGTHVVTIVAWGGVGKTSLVVEWMARQARDGWVGFERVFDWSFYSQGTREQGAASGDAFVSKALEFFGDKELANSPASPWEKGARLAQLVAQRRTLLVLDGLEPLQYPPGPLAGQLKDPAVEVLLKGLAQKNPGLCVVTTRESVANLAPFNDTTAPESDLEHLSDEAGAALLHRAGANRAGAATIRPDDPELRAASREVDGHALTLRLVGGHLALTANGDVRQRDRVHLDEADGEYKTNPADADKAYGHAFKAMAAYERWLANGGLDGQRQLGILRLLGLFDRPAGTDCITALRREPAIAGLTDPLIGLSEGQWNATLKRLAACGLVTVEAPSPVGEGRGEGSTIDAHPLIREYFARQLREKNLDGWRLGHGRLYEHLRDSTDEGPEPSLDDLQPLYQAVAHGCQAGLQQKACDEVYFERILRGDEFYSTHKLGAVGADLGAVAHFFERPWNKLAPELSESAQSWLLSEAAYRLSALGRSSEALEPMRAALQIDIKTEQWLNAGIQADSLSIVESTLGLLTDAIHDAEQSVVFADQSGDMFQRLCRQATLGNVLFQVGRRDEALRFFVEAENLQAEHQPRYPLLYSLRGFGYCKLLLAEAERAAWQGTLDPNSKGGGGFEKICVQVRDRAAQALRWAEFESQGSLLDVALSHVALGCVALHEMLLRDSETEKVEARETARDRVTAALNGLHRAATQDLIPGGLLSRAWLRSVEGDADGARGDLDEAWQIAERGPMRLHMCDIHLYRARLFYRVTPYPWKSAKEDLAAARKLIEECGYHRRDGELEDAEKVIGRH